MGILMPYPETDRIVSERVRGFRDELQKLGWGSANTDVVERWVGDDLGAIGHAATELVAADPDVILTTGSRVVPVLQRATRTVPIVFAGISDPVGQKLVASLARPGNNTTGNSVLEFVDGRSPLMGKLVEIMHQLSPQSRSATLVYNAQNPASAIYVPSFEAAVRARGWEPFLRSIRTLDDIEAAFAAMAERAGSTAILPSDLTLLTHRETVVSLAETLKIPAIYSDDGFVDIGGLASYSADRAVLFRRAAVYVDRILRGERPEGMPVEQPTRYEFTINAKAARGLGLSIPPALLALADDIVD